MSYIFFFLNLTCRMDIFSMRTEIQFSLYLPARDIPVCCSYTFPHQLQMVIHIVRKLYEHTTYHPRCTPLWHFGGERISRHPRRVERCVYSRVEFRRDWKSSRRVTPTWCLTHHIVIDIQPSFLWSEKGQRADLAGAALSISRTCVGPGGKCNGEHYYPLHLATRTVCILWKLGLGEKGVEKCALVAWGFVEAVLFSGGLVSRESTTE